MKLILSLLTALLLAPLHPAEAADPFATHVPTDYQVFQRGTGNQGTVTLSGSRPEHADVEWRISGTSAHGNLPAGWQKVPAGTDSASFSAQIRLPAGGWYRLQVRATRGGELLGEHTVEHVGVGEVFVVAGQSNSANHGEEIQQTGTGLVVALREDGLWQVANDPQPGASGNRGSFMPAFGDALVERFKVPVGIVACGVGATSVREWLPKGATFPNPPTIETRVAKLPDGQWKSEGTIFPTFTARMKQLGPRGFRAVLWHQGESDANQKDPTRTLPGQLYREILERIIRDSRVAIGWNVPWFVAQASYHVPGDESSSDIRAAQAALSKNGIALPGPDTDKLKGELRENGGKGVHFSGRGQRAHAVGWLESVAPWLEQQLK